jgi:hypothetical protein
MPSSDVVVVGGEERPDEGREEGGEVGAAGTTCRT